MILAPVRYGLAGALEAIGLQRVVVSGQTYTVDECKVPHKAVSLCTCLCVWHNCLFVVQAKDRALDR